MNRRVRELLAEAALWCGLALTIALLMLGIRAVRANERGAKAAKALQYELRENAQFTAGDGR